ncbi:hypothetical protein D9758_004999 [Tetrapyrgos nigripes]|uniref:ABM domain-containing protein n=1 Tax=Tetrapyrgos nigripes TaxID=182062 RepID=A0A8H5GVN7_9AGAR|nr:hypothetical protein D9758_004999 [Tetrapyrgos nigripes]
MGGFDDVPEQTKTGKIIAVATLQVKPGKEARFEELISNARDAANSDKEPGTLTYRTNREVDKSGKPTGKYLLFEEYAGKAGFTAHCAQPPLQALLAETDIIASMNLDYAEGKPVIYQ